MPIPSNSILSWKDQVKKENVKILEAKIIVPKEEKVNEKNKIKECRIMPNAACFKLFG